MFSVPGRIPPSEELRAGSELKERRRWQMGTISASEHSRDTFRRDSQHRRCSPTLTFGYEDRKTRDCARGLTTYKAVSVAEAPHPYGMGRISMGGRRTHFCPKRSARSPLASITIRRVLPGHARAVLGRCVLRAFCILWIHLLGFRVLFLLDIKWLWCQNIFDCIVGRWRQLPSPRIAPTRMWLPASRMSAWPL